MTERWYCDPHADTRKCRSLPCHGHDATRDQLLTAHVLAWQAGEDLNTMYQTERRRYLTHAWIALQAIRQPASR